MATALSSGCLYLIPTPLGSDQDPARTLPPATLEVIARLDYFVAENARSARAVLKRLPLATTLQQLEISELSEHTREADLPALLAPVLAGRDAGVLSEAGCPAVADPGSSLVALAHAHGVRVVPLVGPSSLLLALMASGLDGQRFAFAGYVPVAPAERAQRLRALERRSAVEHETEILIETPYRVQALFDTALESLAPGTRLGLASDLTLQSEQTRSMTVARWRELRPTLAATPTVFTLLAEPAPAHRPAQAGRAPQPGRARPPSRR